MGNELVKGKIKELHPCFGAKQNKGRIHLPVCPGCNIECNFCDRRINDHEKRPGVASSILSPREAAEITSRAIELCPEISVAGIAGPGDTLASNRAFETFALIHRSHPELIKCMSTNGLLLAERAEEVIKAGIGTLTVTVNAVDPRIQSQIVARIYYHGKVYTGEEAAECLIENQLEGIRRVAAEGITVKVNTVLINEINREHVKEVAKAVAGAGASLYNIIPLIPQNRFKALSEPDCPDIDGARREAEQYIDVFRHCQRCRADAAGIPGGKDVAELLYQGRLHRKDTFSHG
jgi:nitrogen fixation protein NifB